MSEQVLIRNLPTGTKNQLRVRAKGNGRSMEAEARTVLIEGLTKPPLTLVDLLSSDDDLEFEPVKLNWRPREIEWQP